MKPININSNQQLKSKANFLEEIQTRKTKKKLWKILKNMQCSLCDSNCNEHCVAILRQIRTLEIELKRGKSKYINQVDVGAKIERLKERQEICQANADLANELELERSKRDKKDKPTQTSEQTSAPVPAPFKKAPKIAPVESNPFEGL